MLRYCNNIHSQRLKNVWGVREMLRVARSASSSLHAVLLCAVAVFIFISDDYRVLRMKFTTATALDYFMLVLFSYSFLFILVSPGRKKLFGFCWSKNTMMHKQQQLLLQLQFCIYFAFTSKVFSRKYIELQLNKELCSGRFLCFVLLFSTYFLQLVKVGGENEIHK